MAKLDKESDLGYLDNQSEIGKAAKSAQLESGENLCESNLRMTNLMSIEKSSDTTACLGDGVIHSQTAEVIQDQDNLIANDDVKEKQLYIPPHRRTNQDWQEHVKQGFSCQQWNINSKLLKGSEENSELEGAQLGPVLGSSNNLVGTEGKQISLGSEDIPERVEVNTYSKDSLRNLTKSIEIQVGMDYLKPQSRDASV